MANILQIKRGLKASIPTLAAGELAFCTDTYELYAGTGAANKIIGGPNPTFDSLMVDTNTLYIDKTNHRVGIGKTNPATTLDINGTAAATLFSGPLSGNSSTASKLRYVTTVGDVDLNTFLSGGGAARYYGEGGVNIINWPFPINNPYGSAFQFNSSGDTLALQLAANAVHNVSNPTTDLWFRTRNNLGFGTGDWKAVLHSGNYNTYAPSLSGTGATGTWGISISGTAANVTGTVAPDHGGTGQTGYAVGDLLYASGAAALSKLADVAAGSFLRSGGVGAAPAWSTLVLPNAATAGDMPYASGANTYANLAKGTAYQALGMNSGATAPAWQASLQSILTAAGDIIYASGANTPARLAKGTAYQALGMNSGATAPAWMASLQSILTAAGDIIYASGANTPARLAKGTAGQVLRMNSGATAPEWATPATSSGVLAGSIIAWPTATVPTGYLECAGAAVSRTTYADLFAVISDDYGAGDGSTTFNLPDFRGYFLRGWAHGQTTDPDKATRTDRGDSTTGDYVGTKQADAYKSHQHTATTSSIVSNANSMMYGGSGSVYAGCTVMDASGGNETRPLNVNVMWCIKY